MEIKLTDELNAVFAFSREEALRTGNYGIGPDHLMLGILRHGKNSACSILKDLDVDLDKFKQLIDSRITTTEEIPFSSIEKIGLTRTSQNLVSMTLLETRKSGCYISSAVHLLLALTRVEVGYATSFLRNTFGVSYDRIASLCRSAYPPPVGTAQEDDIKPDGVNARIPAGAPMEDADPHQKQEPIALEEYGVDLVSEALRGKLDPVQGRDAEIERVIQILGRRKKNNPMLVGEPGVGKSAIVEGIARRIAFEQVPDSLSGKKLFSLDLASVVAGTKFRGEFEKRLKGIINAIALRDDIILFIDEFHTIVGAGKAEGGLDAANILKPALARGQIRCIGATTTEEFTRFIEKDGALDRRFQKISVEKTDYDQTLSILHLIAPRYEQHHHIQYSPAALEASVRLSDRYIASRCLPDKAVDVMDEAGSMVRLKGESGTVTPDDVAAVISRITGIPVGRIARSETERLLGMASALKNAVIGQNNAVDKLCRAICRSRAGIKDPSRPIGTFLFYGPTGVGKTLLAKSLAEYMFDSSDAIVRIDMSEYMEKHSVSRLVGAPPGYVGFEDNGLLTEPVRRHPYCVVLLDEIEKAHPDVFNILLQVMDEGRLTDSHGRTVSFRNAIIILTSNVGSREVSDRGAGVGFRVTDDSAEDFRESIVRSAIARTFPPEFIGRLDEEIFFNPLSRRDIEDIVDLEISKIRRRVAESGFTLRVSAATKKRIADSGFNPRFGARPLRKAILEIIEDPVSEKIIQARMTDLNKGGIIRI